MVQDRHFQARGLTLEEQRQYQEVWGPQLHDANNEQPESTTHKGGMQKWCGLLSKYLRIMNTSR